MGGSEASTQLELAAIFAAFVAVTTLFSFVSIGANALGGKIPEGAGVYPVLAAGEPRLAPVGDIIGYPSGPGLSGDRIDALTFIIANTGREGAVDLSRATVTVMAGNYLEVLTRSEDLHPEPGAWTTSLPGDSDGNVLLRAGEECAIHISLGHLIPAGEIVTVRVRLPGDRPCLIAGEIGARQGGSFPED